MQQEELDFGEAHSREAWPEDRFAGEGIQLDELSCTTLDRDDPLWPALIGELFRREATMAIVHTNGGLAELYFDGISYDEVQALIGELYEAAAGRTVVAL